MSYLIDDRSTYLIDDHRQQYPFKVSLPQCSQHCICAVCRDLGTCEKCGVRTR